MKRPTQLMATIPARLVRPNLWVNKPLTTADKTTVGNRFTGRPLGFHNPTAIIPTLRLALAVMLLATQVRAAVPGTPAGTSPGSTSSPGPTMASTSVTLSWNPVPGATYYD